jgi:uncharacterized protein (TIGR00251 family)
MIAVTPHAEGAVLPVRAQPGARTSGVAGEHAGALKLAVSAAPEKGKANRALAALLSELLGVRRSQVELVSGAASPAKRFLIRGLTAEELRARVARLLM